MGTTISGAPHHASVKRATKIPASDDGTKGHHEIGDLEDFVLAKSARSYADKSALKAVDTELRQTSALYSTLARAAAGDRGGGRFIWSAADLSAEVTADTTEGAYIAPTGEDGSDGAFVRIIEDGYFDISWCGASTASSDNKAALDAANALANSLGLALFIPPGTWRVERWQPLAGTRVVGSGHRLSILKRKASSATNYGAVEISTANVSFEHVCFDGDKSGQTNGANTVTVTGSSAYGSSFRFCRFTSAKTSGGGYGDGLVFSGAGDNSNEHGATVFGCVFEANDTDGLGLKETYNAGITNNIFRQNGGSGIAVANFDSPVENASQRVLLIAHNLCVDNSGSGIVIHGFTTGSSTSSSPIWGNASQTTWHPQVIANRCRHNDLYGIAFQASHGVLMANVCADNGGTGYIYGGILFNADYSLCTGNVCYNNEFYGIDAGGAYRCEITNNVCELNGNPSSSNGGTGINLGAARDTRCAGNHCFNNGDSNAGTQILMTRYDSAGSGLGYPWEAEQNVIEENFVGCANNNQVGIWLRQGPVNCLVKNNVGRGGTENKFIVCEATAHIQDNQHVSFIGGTTVASASSIVIPDYAQKIVVTGTTDITGGILTYSRNAYSGKAAWVAMTNRGANYTSAPAVGMTGGTGSGFAGTAYITNDGQVAGVLITSFPTGCNGAETLTFTGGGGSGAAGTLQFGVPNILGAPRRFIFAGALTVSEANTTYLRGKRFRSDSSGRSMLTLDQWYGTNFHEVSRQDDTADEPQGFRNLAINGDFRIWQRGSTFDSTTTPANDDAAILADRWVFLADGADICDVSRESTVVPTGGARRAIKLDVETANKKFGIAQLLEREDAQRLRSQPWTLTFKACKVVGNATVDKLRAALCSWSGTTDSPTRDLVSGTSWGAEGTNPTLATSWAYVNTPSDLTLTDSFQTFTIQGTDAGTLNNAAIFIWCDNGDATVGDLIYITDVQLEIGLASTRFERRPYAVEFAMCQRFLQRHGRALHGVWKSASKAHVGMAFPVPMRTSPTPSLLTTAPVIGEFEVSDRTGTSSTIVASQNSAEGSFLSIDGFGSATAGNAAVGKTDPFIEFTAEF